MGARKTISEMGPWDFWSRPDAVGLPAADVAALIDGTADESQQARAQIYGNAARNALIAAQANEPVRRPS